MPKYMLIALEPAQIRLEGDESIKKKGEGEMFSTDQRKPGMSLNLDTWTQLTWINDKKFLIFYLSHMQNFRPFFFFYYLDSF